MRFRTFGDKSFPGLMRLEKQDFHNSAEDAYTG